MATHPYISGASNVSLMVAQLRRAFPATVNSETVKKLGLAPNNESYVINVLQFIEVLDDDGKKTPIASKTFSQNQDEEFAKQFGVLVKTAYAALFDLHGEESWTLTTDHLITFFRQSDQTSAAIGARQAATFKVLAGLSGHGDVVEPKVKKANKTVSAAKAASPSKQAAKFTNKQTDVAPKVNPHGSQRPDGLGLTVRIEINLPADGSKETYDNIFKSIKENLLGG
jgi:Family of unknown function (DUF5343)